MPVHDVAVRGFGPGARAHERRRPSYPPAALDWLAARLPLGPRVCDVGAGTGKLTRLLADRAAVVAVEPLAGMRDVLAAEVPAALPVGGVVEALPFRPAAFDTALVAQAFHWFATDTALDELARVVRPGGGVALLWNVWDVSVPWVRTVQQLVADAGATPQWRRGHCSRDWAADALAGHAAFAAPERARLPYAQVLDPDGLVERVATTSHEVAAPAAARDALLRAVRDVLDRDPATSGRDVVELPYVTEILTSVRA